LPDHTVLRVQGNGTKMRCPMPNPEHGASQVFGMQSGDYARAGAADGVEEAK
jgi:hypothetical protein